MRGMLSMLRASPKLAKHSPHVAGSDTRASRLPTLSATNRRRRRCRAHRPPL